MSLRQQNKARANANIINAAQELIAEHGLAGTTTRAIAAKAGLSYQTLYNYFPTKAHILQAMMASDLASWSHEIDMVIKRYDGNLLRCLSKINEIELKKFTEKGELWREVTGMLFDRKLEDDQLASASQVAHDRYYALLAMAQGTGELATDVDLHLLAHTLFCLTDHAGIRYFSSVSADPAIFLNTLQDQLSLLLKPYLSSSSSKS